MHRHNRIWPFPTSTFEQKYHYLQHYEISLNFQKNSKSFHHTYPHTNHVKRSRSVKITVNKIAYTRESPMGICKTLQPYWELDITGADNVLNLEILEHKVEGINY